MTQRQKKRAVQSKTGRRTAPAPATLYAVVSLQPYQRTVFTVHWTGTSCAEAWRRMERGRLELSRWRHWQVIEMQPRRVDDV